MPATRPLVSFHVRRTPAFSASGVPAARAARLVQRVVLQRVRSGLDLQQVGGEYRVRKFTLLKIAVAGADAVVRQREGLRKLLVSLKREKEIAGQDTGDAESGGRAAPQA